MLGAATVSTALAPLPPLRLPLNKAVPPAGELRIVTLVLPLFSVIAPLKVEVPLVLSAPRVVEPALVKMLIGRAIV